MAWKLTKFGKEKFGSRVPGHASGLWKFLAETTYEIPDYAAIQKFCLDYKTGNERAGMFVVPGMGIGAFYRIGSKIKWTETWNAKKTDPVVAMKRSKK